MWVRFIHSKILFIAFSERSDNWHSAKGSTHGGRPEQTFPHISFSGNRSHFQMPVLNIHIFSSLAHLWRNSWPSKARIIFNRCCTSVFGCCTSVFGCRTSVFVCCTSVFGFYTSVFGCCTSVFGCCTSVFRCCTSVFGCCTSVFHFPFGRSSINMNSQTS